MIEAQAATVEIRGFLHLAQRFHPVLADPQRHSGADVVDALLDQRRHAAQQSHSLAPGRGGPVAKRTGCGRHRIARILRRAARKARR